MVTFMSQRDGLSESPKAVNPNVSWTPVSGSATPSSSVPNGKPVDISLEKKVKLPENCHWLTLKEQQELGLDTEEEFIIFL